MTGQLVHVAQPQSQTQPQFQSQSQPQFQSQSQLQFQPQPQAPKKSHKTAIIASIIAGVVILLGILTYLAVTLLFSGPRATVEKACAKTFSEGGYLYDALKDIRGFGDEYTVTSNVNIGYSDSSIALYTQMGITEKDKQLAGTIEYSNSWFTIPEIEYKLQLDESELRLQIPTVDTHIFVYPYTGEKQGYLTEIVSTEDIQAIDSMLELMYNGNPSGDLENTELGVKLVKWYRTLVFEKIQEKEFNVNGSSQKCKGYAVKITGDDMEKLRTIYREYVENAMTEQLQSLGMSADEYTEAVFADIEDMEEATLRFYLYKKELAGIELETEGNIYQAAFHGGDFRTQSTELIVNDVTVCSIEGELDGDEETITMNLAGESATLTFNRSTGAYDLKAENAFEMNGTLSTGNKEMKLTVDQVAMEGDYADYTLSGDIAVTAGSVIDTMNGETFDIGNASEAEYNELFSDLNKLLYGLLGY